MEQKLFEQPVVEWWRGFPVIMPTVLPILSVREQLKEKFQDMNVPLEAVYELLRVCFAAGLVGGDQTVPYDGSTITTVAPHLADLEGKSGQVRLFDLQAIRSVYPVSLACFVEQAYVFFQANEDLFSEFMTADFASQYRYGVLRVESLFSLFGIETMTLADYLGYLAANFRSKKKIFGERFAEIHRSSFVPVDHMEDYNIFEYYGQAHYLGDIEIKGMKKGVHLLFGPGMGESYAGLRLAFAIDCPTASMFDISVDLRMIEGTYQPVIVKIQRSPFQLNGKLEYCTGFVSHGEFPSTDLMTGIQRSIGEQLLGGSDVFYTGIIALATFFADLGYNYLYGWPGEGNKWLVHHDQRAEACCEIYDTKYETLGFRRHSQLWKIGLDGEYPGMLERALAYFPIGNFKSVPIERESEGKLQKTTIPMPIYHQKISERGLARVVETIYDLCEHLEPTIDSFGMLEVLSVLRTNRQQETKLYEERERLILSAKTPGSKLRKKK